MPPDRHPSPSTSTTVGAPSEFSTWMCSPSRSGRTDATGTTIPVGSQSTWTWLGSSAGAACGDGAARGGDGVLGVAALGERHGADGQDRQHRRRGDSSTAAAQPAVPACGDPLEPVLGGIADG